MGRILAIDYGTKRVGLAVTDELRIIAGPLETVHVKDIYQYLEDYFKREQVDIIVVGEARDMNNNLSDSARVIEPFVRSLQKKYKDKSIERMDERFTSVMAQRVILDSGISKKARRNKGLVDKISAGIILQSYLDSKKYTK